MQTERCLSDFWRHDRSDDRVLELVSVLQGSDNLIGLMGSDIRVTWSGQEVSYTDFQRRIVALDYGPLQGERTPFPGSRVDEVIGYAAHEGGHCLWSEPGKDQSIEGEISRRLSTLPQALKRAWAADQQGTLAELCRIQNILEDAYVDCHIAERWEVLGEHIRIARAKLAERRPIDLEAIARQARPDRNAVLNLWIAVSLYDYELPRRMTVRVRKAMTFLLDLTQKAVGTESSHDRHLMAVDAAACLYREFPSKEAPLPVLPQAMPTGSGGSQGQGIPVPVAAVGGEVADDKDDEDSGAGQEGEDEVEEGLGGDGGEDGEEDIDEDTEGEASEAGSASEEEDKPLDKEAPPQPQGGQSQDGQADSQDEDSQQGGDEAGQVGNLDDFDDREVVPVPRKLLEEIADAIAHEIEDLSQSVAEALAEDPRQVAASARKADDDPELARRVTSQVMSQVQEIRRVFDRQQDVQARYLKGLDRGKLDDRRLDRVGAGSLNVFQRRQVLERPDLAVGLLLDVSGSMSGYMRIVEQTAAVFAEGLIRKPGVNFAAWTYTGGYTHVELTRICDRRLGKLCLANVAQGGGTPSGAAIAGVKVLMERMPERKRVLIHFTDGQPDNSHHVAMALQVCRQASIRVYAIGVGPWMGGSLEGQYGSGNWEAIQAVAELPQAVARLIKRLDSFQR
jgi:uncharacterized protein with von Willebrand factor type A (vWA) domain